MSDRQMQADTIALYKTEHEGVSLYTGNRTGDQTLVSQFTLVVDDGEADDSLMVVNKAIYGDQILTPGGTREVGTERVIQHRLNDESGRWAFSVYFATSASGTRWARVRPFSATVNSTVLDQLSALGL